MIIPRRLKVEDALLNEIGLDIAAFAGKSSREAVFSELKGTMQTLGVECGLKSLQKKALWLAIPSKAAEHCARVASYARRHGLKRTAAKIVRVLAARGGG